MLYKLLCPVSMEDGSSIKAVMVRKPTEADLAATRLAVSIEHERRGKPLSLPLRSSQMIAHVIDFPVDVVRKFAVRDCCRLHDIIAKAYREAGIE